MIRAGIVGASGYTGAELMRLLSGHPGVEVAALVGRSKAGQPLGKVLPSWVGRDGRTIDPFEPDDIAASCDVAFCALPHGASAEAVGALRERGLVVFDLSADFRLRDLAVYQEWYGEHGAKSLFGQSVYGLPELYREALRSADLIAVPGCYPTASILALKPLIDMGCFDLSRPLVVDAKSGVSGAGRTAKPSTHLPEASGGIRAYAIAGRHRHGPEIEQELGIPIVFNPHLVPMTRGILASAFLYAPDGISPEACSEAARALYEGSPSVHVLEANSNPDTLWVRGANRALVSYTAHSDGKTIVAQCAIDNLVKGAAGQAVQCMNVRFGLEEGLGLEQPALWP